MVVVVGSSWFGGSQVVLNTGSSKTDLVVTLLHFLLTLKQQHVLISTSPSVTFRTQCNPPGQTFWQPSTGSGVVLDGSRRS